MMTYYFKLACLGVRKTPFLSFLIVAMIAIGIAATMTTYTVSYMMSKDPIPAKSQTLFNVQLDNFSKEYAIEMGDKLNYTLTYQDAMNLIKSDIPRYQVALNSSEEMLSNPARPDLQPENVTVRTTTPDFFNIFEVPIAFGNGWDQQAEDNAAQVIVLSKKTNQRLFNGENSVGQTVLFADKVFTVVGVMEHWSPIPKYYSHAMDTYNDPYDVFIPLNTQMKNEFYSSFSADTHCWQEPEDGSFAALIASECSMINMWVELPDEQTKAQYKDFLTSYAQQQQAFGRFPNSTRSKLLTVRERLIDDEMIPNDGKLAVWLAVLFLIVCLLNCMSLMMAKFFGRSKEVGLRRAVGASKQAIFIQFSVELALLGALGGLLGLALAQLGLKILTSIYYYMPAGIMQMNLSLAATTLLLALLCSLLFGLLPILKASQTTPSSQLKSL
ncbi:ABC transporter permease [Pseudoalteromonas sp. T1lg23B]|uniref:ABC transporter permease n=1 Tax=Pseudoalteromonas sp. T1lg23B TaxID=2077097 RepID=UPI000CF6F589|nr:ABC transporter permease [Pseudoalteromonas sp. T1lg23B]